MKRLELLKFATKEQYKEYFIQRYCKREIYTFSGIKVKFYEDQFEHAFYESANHKKRDKSIFSIKRAERINWIEYVLKNEKAELYVGWNRDKKRYNANRRVSIISPENYVVILNIIDENEAKFITAYLADITTARNIRKAPKWVKK